MKKSSSEGTIYQLPSGSWRAQICIDRQRLSATRRTKGEARAWVQEMQEKISLGMTYEASQTRLEAFMSNWLALKRYSIRPATYDQYELMIRIYIIPRLGKRMIIDLTPVIIQRFIDQLIQQGVGARTIQVTRGILSNALSHAKSIGMLKFNPVELTKSPRIPKRELNIWTEDEMIQFLSSIQGERNEYLYGIALATGMRQAELLGLKWSDIDWRRDVIMVKRQLVEKKGGGFDFSEPKSARSSRVVDLGVGSVDKLRKQYELVQLARRMAKEFWREYDLVFSSTVGTPQNGTNVDKDFKRLIAKTGVPKIRFHDMRHTAASHMLSRGIAPSIVAGMLGHTVAVLLETYTHAVPSMRGEAARVMDELTNPTKFK